MRKELLYSQEPSKSLPRRARPSSHFILSGLRRGLREPARQGRAFTDAPDRRQDVAELSVVAGRVLRLRDAHQGNGEGQRVVERQKKTLAFEFLVLG